MYCWTLQKEQFLDKTSSPRKLEAPPTVSAPASAYVNCCAVGAKGEIACLNCDVTTTDPVLIAAGRVVSMITEFASPGRHYLVLLDDGSVWHFRLGSPPKRADALGRDVVEIDGTMDYGCVRNATGGVLCWDGFDASTDTFHLYPAMSHGAQGIAVGSQHACALRGDGSIFCWGLNDWAQLGHATQGYQSKLPLRAACGCGTTGAASLEFSVDSGSVEASRASTGDLDAPSLSL